jgi:hypothetical protein
VINGRQHFGIADVARCGRYAAVITEMGLLRSLSHFPCSLRDEIDEEVAARRAELPEPTPPR